MASLSTWASVFFVASVLPQGAGATKQKCAASSFNSDDLCSKVADTNKPIYDEAKKDTDCSSATCSKDECCKAAGAAAQMVAGTSAMATGGTYTLTAITNGNWVCWKTAASGTLDKLVAADCAVVGKTAKIGVATTVVCSAPTTSGSFAVEWDKAATTKVAFIECSAAKTAVGVGIDATLTKAAETTKQKCGVSSFNTDDLCSKDADTNKPIYDEAKKDTDCSSATCSKDECCKAAQMVAGTSAMGTHGTYTLTAITSGNWVCWKTAASGTLDKLVAADCAVVGTTDKIGVATTVVCSAATTSGSVGVEWDKAATTKVAFIECSAANTAVGVGIDATLTFEGSTTAPTAKTASSTSKASLGGTLMFALVALAAYKN